MPLNEFKRKQCSLENLVNSRWFFRGLSNFIDPKCKLINTWSVNLNTLIAYAQNNRLIEHSSASKRMTNSGWCTYCWTHKCTFSFVHEMVKGHTPPRPTCSMMEWNNVDNIIGVSIFCIYTECKQLQVNPWRVIHCLLNGAVSTCLDNCHAATLLTVLCWQHWRIQKWLLACRDNLRKLGISHNMCMHWLSTCSGSSIISHAWLKKYVDSIWPNG